MPHIRRAKSADVTGKEVFRRHPYVLPEAYRFSQDVCDTLYSSMGDLFRDAEARRLFNVSVPDATPAELAAIAGLSGSELADWLDVNRPAVAAEMTRRQAFAATLADSLHFICEALLCSEKGKLTVAYALLRKPLKDNLLVLELLLSDPDRFVEWMGDENHRERTIEALHEGEGVLPIIKAALAALPTGTTYDAEMLFQLRFSKTDDVSLESIWQKATHLVTSHASYRTERHNFNFVFTGDDARLSQWHRFYQVVPLILSYYAEVVVALLTRFGGERFSDPRDIQMRRRAAFMLWATQDGPLWEGRPQKDHFTRNATACPACSSPMLGSRNAWLEYYETRRIRCRECGFVLVPNAQGMGHEIPPLLWLRMFLADLRSRLRR